MNKEFEQLENLKDKTKNSIEFLEIVGANLIQVHPDNNKHYRTDKLHLTNVMTLIQRQGQLLPAVVNKVNGRILSGNTRYLAIKENYKTGVSKNTKLMVMWVECWNLDEETKYIDLGNTGTQRSKEQIPGYIQVGLMWKSFTQMKENDIPWNGIRIKNVVSTIIGETAMSESSIKKLIKEYKQAEGIE